MRQGFVAFLLLAVGLSLLFPAGTPAVEATYVLSADRWGLGAPLYAQLKAPVDPLFAALYRFLPDTAPFLLRLWKAWGLLAAGLFFLRARFFQAPFLFQQWMFRGWLVAYALQRWAHPFAVGMPAFWSLLFLYPVLRWPFAQGILWAGLSYLFPQATLFAVWVVYRRIEERAFRALGLFGLGVVWAALALGALHRHLGTPGAYWEAYWLAAWQLMGETPAKWPFLLSGAALLLVWAQGSLYLRRPYAERLAYRDRLWAAFTSLLTADPSALGLWFAAGVEPFSDRLRQAVVTLLLGVHGGQLGYTFSKFPDCFLTLPAESCLWGTPPCYVRLAGSYGCDISSPYRWQRLWRQSDWVQLYQSWGEPRFIWDAAQSWAEVQYRLPLRAKPFVQKDTLLPKPLLLYQRR